MAIARFNPGMFESFVGDNFPIPKENENPNDFPKWCLFVNIHSGQSFDDCQIEHNAEMIGKMDNELFKDKEIKLDVLRAHNIDLEPNNPIWD